MTEKRLAALDKRIESAKPRHERLETELEDKFLPGMYVLEYPAHPTQVANRKLFLPEEALGSPIAERVATLDAKGRWKLDPIRTAFAKGYL